jgi:hypothetical protein
MDRKTVHRGIAALTLAVALTFAGAQPAAAADLGLVDRAVHRLMNLWEGFGSWLSGDEKASATHREETQDTGFGIDPMGAALMVDQPEPLQGAPGGN